MPFPFDMTVVIPVYNKQDSLSSCAACLDGQTATQDSFEVVFVNDGSTDDSLALCEEIASSRSNYVVIDKPNGGVSSARNVGIKAARGRYIMFLDSDDEITKCTIKHLVETFDAFAEEVDLITYPLTYRNLDTGKEWQHKRQRWLTETGVYSLAEYPHLAQSTINVCVKNQGDLTQFFNLSLEMGEDQYFITDALARTGKIGYCDEAGYIYYRYRGNSSSMRNHPLYAFDGMMILFEHFADLAESNPSISRYAYSMILYNVGWRVESNMLFPDFGDEVCRKANHLRLEKVLNKIPVDVWVETPYLQNTHRLFLMKRYGIGLDDVTVTHGEELRATVLFDGKYELDLENPSILIDWITRDAKGINVKGRLRCTTFIFEDGPELSIRMKGKKRAVPLFDSAYCYVGTHFEITPTYGFELVLPPVESAAGYSVTFEVRLNGKLIPSMVKFVPLRRTNSRVIVPKKERDFGDYRAKCDGPTLTFRAPKEWPLPLKPAVALRRMVRERGRDKTDDKSIYKLRKRLPSIMAGLAGKRVWLYSDLPTSTVGGNALSQLKHDLKVDDGVSRYYVSSEPQEIIQSFPELEGHVIELKSQEHIVLFLSAEVILASYLDWPTFMPCDRETHEAIADFSHPKKMVYLQHGILHMHTPWYCSYDRIAFDYEVVSTTFEVRNLMQSYHFPAGALLQTGSPRFDSLRPKTAKGSRRRIAYIPSWRSYLIGGNAKERIPLKGLFAKSNFYQGMMGFLEAVAESGVLDEYDYQLDVKLHPNFSAYDDLLSFDSPRISFVQGAIDEADYSIAITDFSSYVYDFVYCDARVLYFVPDEVEFEAGLNHYSQLDMPYQDGFGPYATDSREASRLLAKIISDLENDAPLDERYAKKYEGFFIHNDFSNSERLYEEVLAIANGARAAND